MQGCVEEVLARKGHVIETTRARATVLAAVERMNQLKVGALLVTDGDRPLGIITERDVMSRVIAERVAPESVLVGEVTVVEGDRVFGLVSIGDLTSWLVRDQQRTIEDLQDFICHA